MIMASQRFVLPFDVLLETLRGWHEPLMLSATLPPAPAFGSGKTTAILSLLGGQVQLCMIVNTQGVLLAQQQTALIWLSQVDTLEWLVSLEAATRLFSWHALQCKW